LFQVYTFFQNIILEKASGENMSVLNKFEETIKLKKRIT